MKTSQCGQLAIYLLFTTFFSSGLLAQTNYKHIFAGGDDHCISLVRSYSCELAIVYYRSPSEHKLNLINLNTGDYSSIPVDDNFIGHDMAIAGDTIFVGGEYYSGAYNVACVLHMPISVFFLGGGSINYGWLMYWTPASISKIDAYMDMDFSNHWKVVGIGTTHYDCNTPHNTTIPGLQNHYGDPYQNMICETNFTFEFSGATQYSRVAFINPLEHPNEIIHDVAVTDNYVAFVGYEGGDSNVITLHVCDKKYVLFNDPSLINSRPINGFFSNYYKFPLPTTAGNPEYHICAIKEDSIALVSTNEDSQNPSLIWMKTIDLNTKQMGFSQIIKSDCLDLLDITYIPDSNWVLTLYHGILPTIGNTGRHIFCPIRTYTNSSFYNTNGLIDSYTYYKYSSIDKMNGCYNDFISTGGNYGILGRSYNNATGVPCYKTGQLLVYKTSTINKRNHYFKYDIINRHVVTTTNQNVCTENQLVPKCYEQ